MTFVINLDLEHNGAEIDVFFICEWEPGQLGNRRGHPDTWEPDEPETFEIICAARGEVEIDVEELRKENPEVNLENVLRDLAGAEMEIIAEATTLDITDVPIFCGRAYA